MEDGKKKQDVSGKQKVDDLIVEKDAEELRNGSYEAYNRIYLAWHKPVYHLLLRLTGSGDEAEDITQEVFLGLWEYRGKIDPSKKINTFLYMVAKRIAIDHFRRRKSAGQYLGALAWDEIATTSTDSLIITKEINLLKELAVSRMPEFRRRIYTMNETEGLNSAEIAGRLGISRESVYTQLSIARKQLRELIRCLTVLL